jgi:hypothetical protein
MMGKCDVELILKINKYCYLLYLDGLDFITLPTSKMHGQTQIKFYFARGSGPENMLSDNDLACVAIALALC